MNIGDYVSMNKIIAMENINTVKVSKIKENVGDARQPYLYNFRTC